MQGSVIWTILGILLVVVVILFLLGKLALG
jgi:hypothetical protein